MSDVLIDQDTMEDIGDAIREKLGVSDTYLPASMPAAIRSISGGGGEGSISGSSPFIDSSGASIKLDSGTNSGGTWTATIDCFVTFYANWGGNKFFEIYIDESVRILYPYNETSSLNRFEYIYVKKGQVLKWKFSDNSSNYHIVTAWPLLKNDALQTALIYSEEEREVGVWTDGKPLYQKTVSFGALPNNTTKSVAHGIQNADFINPINVFAYYPNAQYNTSIPVISLYNVANGFAINVTDTNIDITTRTNASPYSNCYVTLQYTKTTDTPGSGIWTTTGEYAHHYSTDEHIVGTWIDGSTIYEKTLTFSTPISTSDANSSVSTPITLASMSIDKLIKGQAFDNARQCYPATLLTKDNETYLGFALGYNNRRITALTIQYTKTA